MKQQTPSAERGAKRKLLLLNVAIGLLGALVVYLSYSLIARHVVNPPVDPVIAGGEEVVQLDVLNGCGVRRAASDVTSFLRARGFDVVEIRNYKTFDVERSMVIDRAGDGRNAERVAYALGVSRENIIHELNPDYYVHVSVVIGKDFATLKSQR